MKQKQQRKMTEYSIYEKDKNVFHLMVMSQGEGRGVEGHIWY
jgi:hypothetical protein